MPAYPRVVCASGGGVGATVLALQQASYWSWTSPATLLTLAAGLALTAGFAIHQLRDADPVVNVRLFARRGYAADVLVLGLMQFGLLAIVLYGSLYLQDLLHQGPDHGRLGGPGARAADHHCRPDRWSLV